MEISTITVRNRHLSKQTKHHFKYILMVNLMFAGLISCNRIDQYHEYHPVQQDGWFTDSSLVFHYEAKDTLGQYAIALNVRHQSEYPYQNLWIFSSITDKDSLAVRDSFNIFLANDQGEWYGGGLGIVYHYEHIMYPAFRFPKPGMYTFELKHGMRDSILTGIREAGLKITPIQHGQK